MEVNTFSLLLTQAYPVFKNGCLFLKKLNMESPFDPEIPQVGIYPRQWKIYVYQKLVHGISEQHYLQ